MTGRFFFSLHFFSLRLVTQEPPYRMVARGVIIKDLKNKAISSPPEEEKREASPAASPAALPLPSSAATVVANDEPPAPSEPVKLAMVHAPQNPTFFDSQTVFNIFCITALFFCFVFLILIYAQLCKISNIMERVIFSNRR